MTIDLAARRYGQRPSAVLGLTDPWEAVVWDAVCARAGYSHDAEHGPIPALLAALSDSMR